MTTKAASSNGITRQEAGWLKTIDACLAEMGVIRRRMKATDQRIRAANQRNHAADQRIHAADQRIRRADAAISRCQAETRAILRHVQASR